jgi:hypothetical protein
VRRIGRGVPELRSEWYNVRPRKQDLPGGPEVRACDLPIWVLRCELGSMPEGVGLGELRERWPELSALRSGPDMRPKQ